MRAPCLRFDLDEEISRLWREAASGSGRNAKTLVKHPDLRIVLTVLRGGHRIHEHKASGRISVQTIRGHIRMHLSAGEACDTMDLPAGHLVALDREVPHDVVAVVDSAFVLTIAWPEGGQGDAGQRVP
jgi:quercetin dioxygenase-like cupin family protein